MGISTGRSLAAENECQSRTGVKVVAHVPRLYLHRHPVDDDDDGDDDDDDNDEDDNVETVSTCDGIYLSVFLSLARLALSFSTNLAAC